VTEKEFLDLNDSRCVHACDNCDRGNVRMSIITMFQCFKL